MCPADNGLRAGKRRVLADYVEERVIVTGVLAKLTRNRNLERPYQVALLEDAEVELPSRERHDLGHLWVRNAETLSGVPVGSRVRCSCRVYQYTKGSGKVCSSGEQDEPAYSVCYPREVSVLPPPVALLATPRQQPSVSFAPVAPPAAGPEDKPGAAGPADEDPMEVIRQVRAVCQRLGGAEGVAALRILVEQLGGWDGFEELVTCLKL